MKTKKLILVIFLTFIGAIGAYAQKTNVRMQETQARLLDVTSNAYVKPLTVELQIDKSKGRIKDEWTLTREQAEQEMNGDLVNIRSYAIYMSSQKHNADVIVAATFNVKTNDDGNGYKVTSSAIRPPLSTGRRQKPRTTNGSAWKKLSQQPTKTR